MENKTRFMSLVLLFNFSFSVFNYALAQQPVSVKKSERIETIDGKKFYIHHVEKGQTLYSIAKIYGSTVDIILSNNTDAIDGIKAGENLKIPFLAGTENIKKEIEKKESYVKKDTSRKHLIASDLKNAVNVLSPIQKNDTISKNQQIKPIGDIHVALFLPLSLNDIDSIDVQKISSGDEKISDEILTGIEFYEGMKMAFDSIRKKGFKGFLHVYDSRIDSATFTKLFKKSEMKGMNLIIGPLYGKQFQVILKFAKENKINIVCPALTGNNILLGNTNVSKVTPSFITQTEFLAKYVTEKFAGCNIILFNSAIPKEKPYLNAFKKTANPALAKSKKDTIKEVTFSTLNDFISSSKPNIVVIPSANQSFVAEAINKLFLCKQEQKDSIVVFGLSSFQDMESLDFGSLNALHSHIASYTFIDYTNPQTKKFILDYRKEFKTDPAQYVFLGFDVGCFYLSGLQQYGNTLYKKLPELHKKGIQSEFNFYQPDMNSGYENRGVGIMKFENYSYTRVK